MRENADLSTAFRERTANPMLGRDLESSNAIGRWMRFPRLWLIVFLVLGISLPIRCSGTQARRCVSHDEAVSLIAASGNELEYPQKSRELETRWVPASEWQSFHEIDEPFCFTKIRSGLIKYDKHPPLYFWLMHLAALAQGGPVTVTSGLLVNILTHAVGALLLLLLAIRITRSGPLALCTVVIWTFSPSTMSTTLVARQYELLGVLGVATALSAIGFLQATARRAYAWFAALLLSQICIASTQLQGLAALVYVGTISFAFLACSRLGRGSSTIVSTKRALVAATSPMFAACVGLAIYPAALREIGRKFPSFPAVAGWQTLGRSLHAASAFFGVTEIGPASFWLLVLLAALLVFPLAVWLWGSLRVSDDAQRRKHLLNLLGPLGLLVVGGAVLGQYAGFRPTQPTIPCRYLALLFPFLALTSVQALEFFGGRRARWAPGLLAIFVAAQALPTSQDRSDACVEAFGGVIPLYDAVLIDHAGRGTFLRSAPYLHPDAKVFVFSGPLSEGDRMVLLEGLRSYPSVLVLPMPPGSGHRVADGSAIDRVVRQTGKRWEIAHDPSAALDLRGMLVFVVAVERHFSDRFLRLMTSLGSEFERIKSGGRYAGVVGNGRVFQEELAEGAPVRLRNNGSLSHLDFEISVGETTDELVRVRIAEHEYVSNRLGLHLVVWDPNRRRVRYEGHFGEDSSTATAMRIR